MFFSHSWLSSEVIHPKNPKTTRFRTQALGIILVTAMIAGLVAWLGCLTIPKVGHSENLTCFAITGGVLVAFIFGFSTLSVFFIKNLLSIGELQMQSEKELHDLLVVTAERQALEDELKKYRENLEKLVEERTLELKQSEERLELALKGGDLGFWDVDLKHGVGIVNSRWFEVLGYINDEFKPTQKNWIKTIHPEDRELVIQAGRDYREARVPVYEIEYRAITKDGEERWLYTKGSVVVRDEAGVPTRMAGTVMDITARKMSEVNLKRAKEQAEEATLLKDKFVSLVAHDLRSPLSSIVGLMDYMLEDTENPLTALHHSLLTDARASGASLVKMVEDILSIGRLQTGKIKLNANFFDAHYLIRDILLRLEHVISRKGVRVENTVGEGRRLFADVTLFGEVIQNLLTNAVKFSRPNDVIRVYCPEGEETTICVEDHGVGISPENIPKLFSIDEKISTPGTAGELGTGFGLPFSFDIMEAHSGRLTTTSQLGVGSVFSVYLPKVKPRIMVVDNSKTDRLVIMANLHPLDVEILEAESGHAALAQVLAFAPHLIIADISMPEMDGFTLLTMLKKDPETANIPVILITGNENTESRSRAFRCGAADFAVKPLVIHEFLPRVQNYIG